MEEYQLVAPHQEVLPPIPVIVDVHEVEVEQEPVREMEHGVAMPQPVNVCDRKNQMCSAKRKKVKPWTAVLGF